MNKSKTILIGMIFIFLIINFNFIYSASNCWAVIECGEHSVDSGTTFHTDYTEEAGEKEILCKLIEIGTGKLNEFEIEIVQGQFEGGEKKWSVYIDKDYSNFPFDISFILSKATSPTYVLCHETGPSTGATQNPIRIATRNYWMASFDQQWFKQNAGMAEYEDYENLKNWNQNNTYNNSDKNSLHVTNEETTTQQENNDNRILLILFGILVCVLSVGIYILTYKKGYKIIGIGIWFSLSLFSLIILNDPYRLLSLIGIFFSIYLMIIWIKENAISIIKGKKDKI